MVIFDALACRELSTYPSNEIKSAEIYSFMVDF
jgi:hypothetical protein